MKSLISSSISLSLLLLVSVGNLSLAEAETKTLKSDFQTLGDNQEVIDRVQKLDNQQRIRVVQNRMMDRNNRLELALNLGALSGGDSYVQTKNLGAMLQFHINPKWSVGLTYEKDYNSLNAEGSRRYDAAFECQKTDPSCATRFPAVDFPIDTRLLSVTYYPIYGKLNLFDAGIAQFDLYTTLAYGQKTLNSGISNVLAASVGAGVWLNSFLTARLEGRYESYKDLLQTENRLQSGFSVIASLGAMLW